MKRGRALVLFSGGQDSATCLAWALSHYSHVETVGFDYGQRHRIELEARLTVRRAFGETFPHWRLGEDHLIDASVLGALSETALTRDVEIKAREDGLPNTFVPGRNLLFLVLAGALASRRGLTELVGGMCETDFSGYPDCRDDALKAMQVALNLGMAENFTLHTPLMWLDKADTWALAHRLGDDALINLILEHSHTCYEGVREARHDWGYGCGICPACELRAKGYEGWRAKRL